MAHDEAPVGKFMTDRLILSDAGETMAFGISGSLKLSGSKLYLDTGTAWEIVTST